MTWNKKQPKTYYDIKHSKKRIIINQGGSSAGKTYSALQAFIELAFVNRNKPPHVISIVRASLPALKKSALRDFKNILLNNNIPFDENKTELMYKVFNTYYEFIGLDDAQKARGPRRWSLFVNEANELSYEKYKQLALRTEGRIVIDFNPSEEFWAHTELKGRDDVDFFVTNYTHNPHLSEEVIKEIERYKNKDPNYWKVYGLGELGVVEGLVYPNYSVINEFPEHIEHYGYGLDFGFSNDETALIKVAIKGDDLYLHEEIYQTGLITSDLIKMMNQKGISRDFRIIADVKPDAIEEIKRAGYPIKSVNKAPLSTTKGSIIGGIGLVKSYNIKVTSTSFNLIKELKNYKNHYNDKLDRFTNEPIDLFNHALDAVRYYVLDNHREKRVRFDRALDI